MNAAQIEAIAQANAELSNTGLPTFDAMQLALQQCEKALRILGYPNAADIAAGVMVKIPA